jgi:hypothetical protein
METDTEIWDFLVEKLKPATVDDSPIKSIGINIREGGIMATTLEPTPTYDYNYIDEDFDIEECDISEMQSKLKKEEEEMQENPEKYPENESVFIYEQIGNDIKQKIMERLSKSVSSTPTLSSTEYIRGTVTEDKMSAVFEISHHSNEEWIKKELGEILTEQGHIDKPDELAYGTIDNVYSNERSESSFSGWEFDGTLYRYTDAPFEYWSKGQNSEYPTNMAEWEEFASESEIEKSIVKNRDKHIIHFHPMEHQLNEDHPLIQWFKKVEELSLSQYEIQEEYIESFRLSAVSMDDSGVNLRNTIVL